MKNRKTKIAFGLFLLPFATIIHLADRFIVAFMPWLEQKNIIDWFNDSKTIMHSMIRFIIIAIIYTMYSLINMRING